MKSVKCVVFKNDQLLLLVMNYCRLYHRLLPTLNGLLSFGEAGERLLFPVDQLPILKLRRFGIRMFCSFVKAHDMKHLPVFSF